ncbi:DMT family transporter [Verrucomicrobiaceae bacterium R5-34]|nr:DMT family transporter [Verrucomicrobiaceae bacterium R5-34]
MCPFAVLLCALLWGSAFPGIKAIYAEWENIQVLPDMQNRLLLAGVRFIIGGFVLLLISKSPIKQLKSTPFLPLLGFAAAQTGIQYAMFYTALAVSSAVLGGLLVASGSFWWLLLAPLILKTPWPTRVQWSLIGIGAAGVLLAVYKPGAGSGQPVLGGILFCASTLSGTLGVIILQRVLKTMGARAATGYGLLLGGIMLTLAGAGAWSDFTQLFNLKVILLTCYLAMVSAVGFGLWNYLTSLFPVNLLAGYRFLVPVCAVVESSLLVAGETPGLGIWIGGLLVIFSVVALQRVKVVQ